MRTPRRIIPPQCLVLEWLEPRHLFTTSFGGIVFPVSGPITIVDQPPSPPSGTTTIGGTTTTGTISINNTPTQGTISAGGSTTTSGSIIIGGSTTTIGSLTTSGTLSITTIGSPTNSTGILSGSTTFTLSTTSGASFTIFTAGQITNGGSNLTYTLGQGTTGDRITINVGGTLILNPIITTGPAGTFSNFPPTDTFGPQSTVTLTSSTDTPVVGQPITITATATTALGTTPEGQTINFYAGGSLVATSTITNGTASFVWTPNALGFQAVTADLVENSTFAAGGLVELFYVQPVTTSLTLSAPADPVHIGDPVTLTVNASTQFGQTPDGQTVSLIQDGQTYATSTITNGTATFTWTPTTAGTHSLTAALTQNSTYAAATSNTLSIQTAKTALTATLSGPDQTLDAGGAITLTATFSSDNQNLPVGQMAQLYELLPNGPTQVDAAVIQSDGTATFHGVEYSAGTSQFFVQLPETDNYLAAATNTVTLTTQRSASTLELRTSQQGNLFEIEVAASSADTLPIAPLGSVNFYDGTQLIATASLNGPAEFAQPLSPGAHIITAIYAGNSAFTGSHATLTVIIPGSIFSTNVTLVDQPRLVTQTTPPLPPPTPTISASQLTDTAKLAKPHPKLRTAHLSVSTSAKPTTKKKTSIAGTWHLQQEDIAATPKKTPELSTEKKTTAAATPTPNANGKTPPTNPPAENPQTKKQTSSNQSQTPDSSAANTEKKPIKNPTS